MIHYVNALTNSIIWPLIHESTLNASFYHHKTYCRKTEANGGTMLWFKFLKGLPILCYMYLVETALFIFFMAHFLRIKQMISIQQQNIVMPMVTICIASLKIKFRTILQLNNFFWQDDNQNNAVYKCVDIQKLTR